MDPYLPLPTWDEIRPYFIEQFPKEAIAVVWKDGSWEKLENVHETPMFSFKLSEEDHLELMERADDVLVLLHTHPNEVQHPSDMDSRNQLACGFAWGISVAKGDHSTGQGWDALYPEMWGDTVPIPPLTGREHLWGVRDCFSLVRDYYRTNGRPFRNFGRIKDPTIKGAPSWAADQIVHNAQTVLNMEEIKREDRRPGDAFTQCCGGRGPYTHDHCGIYLGEGKYLHQPLNRLSEIYTPNNLEERWLARHSTRFWRPRGETE